MMGEVLVSLDASCVARDETLMPLPTATDAPPCVETDVIHGCIGSDSLIMIVKAIVKRDQLKKNGSSSLCLSLSLSRTHKHKPFSF